MARRSRAPPHEARVSDANTDAERLVARLADVDALARKQSWDRERPWRASTHIWVEDGLLVVDLHDLGARAAKEAVRGALDLAHTHGLDGGAVCFVTGRGKHSRGQPVMGNLVGRRLYDAATDHPDWKVHILRAGRIALVTNPTRAPVQAQNKLGWGIRLLLLTIALAAAWVCMGMPGVD